MIWYIKNARAHLFYTIKAWGYYKKRAGVIKTPCWGWREHYCPIKIFLWIRSHRTSQETRSVDNWNYCEIPWRGKIQYIHLFELEVDSFQLTEYMHMRFCVKLTNRLAVWNENFKPIEITCRYDIKKFSVLLWYQFFLLKKSCVTFHNEDDSKGVSSVDCDEMFKKRT